MPLATKKLAARTHQAEYLALSELKAEIGFVHTLISGLYVALNRRATVRLAEDLRSGSQKQIENALPALCNRFPARIGALVYTR